MRELWWAACGRIDLDVESRAFWKGAFGQRPTEDEWQRMHPLRRLEMPPPPADEAEEARHLGWDAFERGLASLNRQREG